MTLIYYFTGTGNSLTVAKQLSKQIENSKVISINSRVVGSSEPIEGERVIVVFPAYGYGLPHLVKRFFKLKTIKTEYLAVIVTYGTKYGACFSQARSYLKKKKIRIDAYYDIKTVENYVAIFGFPEKDVIKERISNQVFKTNQIAKLIIKKEGNEYPKKAVFLSNIISFFFGIARPILAKMFKVKPNCTKCQTCVKLCPSQAISIKNVKIKFAVFKCEHCQRCLNLCPAKALQFNKIKPNSARYVNTEVTLKDFLNGEV